MELKKYHKLSVKDFQKVCLEDEGPILITGMLEECEAVHKWSPQYFAQKFPNLKINAKSFQNKEIKIHHWTMEHYAHVLQEKTQLPPPQDALRKEIPYLHDFPIFQVVPSLVQDVLPLPIQYLPKWYQKNWWKYIQFFMGPADSITPLHFDCLLTNNMFFQIKGQKKFTLLPPKSGKHCGRYQWRWFQLNPEKPDFLKFPDYHRCTPLQVVVNPGDILFMPSGMLHHVRSMEESISFNIDFHTRKSALNGLLAAFQGMPIKNVYYNLLIFLGLMFNIPERLIYRFYRSYLNYIS